MAHTLDIIGNHQVNFDSHAVVIEQVEMLLGIKIQNGTYRTVESVGKTRNLSEVNYYCNFAQLELNFTQYKMVRILTNYQYCPEFTIFRKAILYHSNISIKYWLPVLLNELTDASRTAQYNHTVENWEQLVPFVQTTTHKLHGNQLIFLSDRYENIVEECYGGNLDLPDMLNILTKDFSATQIKWIQNNDLVDRLKFTWLNMKLDRNNDWILDPNEDLKIGS